MQPADPLKLSTGPAAEQTQFLTFALGTGEYGVPILNVQEIKGFSPVTPIPNTPEYVRGVMNLRGTIIPVIDLRLRLGMPPIECGPFTVIIVLAVGTRVVGTIVDGVSDVLTIRNADIQTTPFFGTDIDVRFITGLAQIGEKLIVLLDVETMLRREDLRAIGDTAGASS
jgi:purine-binding chemotaxis protein CheW